MSGRKAMAMVLNRDLARRSLVISKQKTFAQYQKLCRKMGSMQWIDDDGCWCCSGGIEKINDQVTKAWETYERAGRNLLEFDHLADSLTDEEIWERWFA